MVKIGYNPSTLKVLMCASGKLSEGCCGIIKVDGCTLCDTIFGGSDNTPLWLTVDTKDLEAETVGSCIDLSGTCIDMKVLYAPQDFTGYCWYQGLVGSSCQWAGIIDSDSLFEWKTYGSTDGTCDPDVNSVYHRDFRLKGIKTTVTASLSGSTIQITTSTAGCIQYKADGASTWLMSPLVISFGAAQYTYSITDAQNAGTCIVSGNDTNTGVSGGCHANLFTDAGSNHTNNVYGNPEPSIGWWGETYPASASNYKVGVVVDYDGTDYKCIADHSQNNFAVTEPETGSDWETYWEVT